MYGALTTDEQLIKMAKRLHIPLNAVLSKNELIELQPKLGGYIVNMQDSTDGNGSHWVCIWLNSKPKISAYYDSFGVDPPLAILDFMKRWSDQCLISTKPIQSIGSGHCGQYNIHFLHHMAYSKQKNPIKRYYNYLKQFN